MKSIFLLVCALLTACVSVQLHNQSAKYNNERSVSRLLYQYEPSTQCSGCHMEQFLQYEDSMHAQAFSNPLFNAQYFNDIVPRAQRDAKYVQEARRCLACHAPAVFMNYTGLVSTQVQANRFETGVTCDFCHTLEGYDGDMNYQQIPSRKKQGPNKIEGAANHHSEYSGFMQLSEYCGHCHNATNHIGLSVKSTYDEWRESRFATKGREEIITCQECHMSKEGFLRKGVAEFESGQAAYMNIGDIPRDQKVYEKLYNHSFPGAHSVKQQIDALKLDFKVGRLAPDEDGKLPFTLFVNNERTGHKMPSGSSYLRFMWLEVKATAEDGTNIFCTLQKPVEINQADYSVAGASKDDAAILGTDVPAGSRLYRTVLVNAGGRQSLYQYDSVKVAFDNRLGPAEIRRESYYLQRPHNYSGIVTLEARLYYKGAPSSFTRRMQVPDFIPVQVAFKKKELTITADHSSGIQLMQLEQPMRNKVRDQKVSMQ